jgi:hypothetical protein
MTGLGEHLSNETEARLRAEVERNTAPFRTPDIAGLCERLRAVESSGHGGVTTHWHRNPDGPEAAGTIERQAAEIERLNATCYLDSFMASERKVERQAAEIERLRESLLGIALSDRYRRYPKQHEDGGVRGQSGLRAVRALTGQHGSYLSDDDVVRLDKEARAALTGEDA